MKKLSLCLMSVFGIFVTACNSGTPSSNVPSGCPNGASQCGATHPTSNYSQAIPSAGANAKLISVNNLVMSSASSQIPINFKIESLTTPTSVIFTTNSGTLQQEVNGVIGVGGESVTVDFSTSLESVVLLLNTTDSANSYTITPTGMQSLILNTQTPVKLVVPYGTYNLTGSVFYGSSDTSGYSDCGVEDYGLDGTSFLVVNQKNGVYLCYKNSHEQREGCFLHEELTNLYQVATMPSFIEYYGFGSYFMYSNIEWSNGKLSYNGSTNSCPGLTNHEIFTYQSSSTALPYDIVSNNSSK